MVIVSDAPLLITAKTVRQSIVPDVEALKMPASVNAPVATPAPTPLDKSKAPRANVSEVLATPATAVAQVAKKGPEEDAEARKKHVTEVQKTLTAKVFNNTPNAP